MNVRRLKAKRVEFGLRQKDLAKALGISTKTMCIKECDNRNRLTIDAIITIAQEMRLSVKDINDIFLTASYHLYKNK